MTDKAAFLAKRRTDPHWRALEARAKPWQQKIRELPLYDSYGIRIPIGSTTTEVNYPQPKELDRMVEFK